MGVIDSLGLRIKELRKKKKLTQDELSEKAGITGKYMGMIERGEVNVSVKILENLAEVLGVQVADFFEFDNQVSPEEQRERLLEMVKSASDSELKLLFKVANTLLK